MLPSYIHSHRSELTMSRLHPLHPARLCAVLSLAMPLLALADPRYTVTAVAGQDSYARGMNNLGQVVGTLAAADTYHAFLYADGSLTDLGLFGGASSAAFAINDAGQVVGTSYGDAEALPTRGFLYSGGAMSAIQAPGSTYAFGINNAGTVVGGMTVAASDGGTLQHAYTYAGGGFTDLGTLSIGDTSRAYAINGAGAVVGAAANSVNGAPNFPENPFIYRNGTMTDMGGLNGIWSSATSINEQGHAVGYVGVDFGGQSDEIYSRTAFLYADGVRQDLGGLAPYRSSVASDINDLGQIVGGAALADGDAHAFLYENGGMIDLNTLIDPASGWTIRDAAAINDLQQIAATACKGGSCQAVRLDLVSAVPEPHAYALLLGGLALGIGRRCGAVFKRPAGRRRG
jgi:probable HAF family extracellular repeat protein